MHVLFINSKSILCCIIIDIHAARRTSKLLIIVTTLSAVLTRPTTTTHLCHFCRLTLTNSTATQNLRCSIVEAKIAAGQTYRAATQHRDAFNSGKKYSPLMMLAR
jgi:hypothetical protein